MSSTSISEGKSQVIESGRDAFASICLASSKPSKSKSLVTKNAPPLEEDDAPKIELSS